MTEMGFCHIYSYDDEITALCGFSDGPGQITCKVYDGEAICPTCGNPTCPRCAQLEAIEYVLEEPS
jgi:hypothetical protein